MYVKFFFNRLNLGTSSAASKQGDFLYPTKLNVLAVFLMLHLLPVVVYFVNDGNISTSFLVKCEAIILALICYWPLRPLARMSADDRAIELKWTNRMFAFSLPCLLAPVLLILLDHETTAWNALNSFAAPVTLIVMVMCTLTKFEQGGFFASPPKASSRLTTMKRPVANQDIASESNATENQAQE